MNQDLSSEVHEASRLGRITAVIVTFNSAAVIRQSLDAVTGCPEISAAIVVDNASSDGTVQLISHEFPTVRLIANSENIGFGPANNMGLEQVETEFAFVLNPDAVVNSAALTALLATADKYPQAAIIGPLLTQPGEQRELVRTGSVWDLQKTRIPSETELEVQFLVGAAMFMRMSLIRHSGFFDPNIFLFHEDDDICRSAKRAGYSLILTSRARISHLVGQSSPTDLAIVAFKQCHFTWSRLYLEKKEHGFPAAAQLAKKQLRKLSRKQLLARLSGNARRVRLVQARSHAVRCFLSNQIPSTIPDDFADPNSSTASLRKGTRQMELTECDLCSHSDFEAISETDRHGDPLKTVICTNCGLVRHAVVPTEEELQKFYSTDYRKAYNGERTPGARRIMRAWNNGLRICQQVSPLLEPKSRILEVGAGIGCTVKVFEQHGFLAEGIDPGGEFLNFSGEQLKANVQVRQLYDLPQEHNYDGVLLIHVIEHLRSPKQALQHIAGLMKPGGMFYVECPNLQAPFARRSKLFHTAHIHNYVPSTLQMLAESCGFRLRQRFGDDRDPNLQMLFQHHGDAQLKIDGENYRRTLGELNNSDPLTYHLRLRYLSDRIRKLSGYAGELLQAKQFVKQLIANCSEDSSADRNSQRRAA